MTPRFLWRVVRFGIAGVLATATSVLALYLFTAFLGIWYVVASAIAFFAGFIVSFTLQKFWTFRDRRLEALQRQAAAYFAIVAGNAGLNALMVFTLVEYAHLSPVFAQVAASLLIACESFFLYRIVFRESSLLHESAGELHGSSRTPAR